MLTVRSDPEKNIAQLIAAEFGISPLILVLNRTDPEDVINARPFPSAEGKTVHFYFCAENPVPDTDRIRTLAADSEAFLLTGHVFYLHAAEGIGRSRLVANIESCLSVSASGRNMNTVLTLRDMAQQSGAL